MRIFIWHGYLLAGTGSNIFARELARQWQGAGHDVTVFSQDPHPEQYDLGGAATVRPDVGGLLPVFVIDDYEGYRVQRVQDTTRAELDAWVAANAAAMRERLPADLVVASHVILGGPVALRRLWDGPETLPREGEIESPERWVGRVMDDVTAA